METCPLCGKKIISEEFIIYVNENDPGAGTLEIKYGCSCPSCALACVLGLQAAVVKVDHDSMLDTKAFSSALPLWPWIVLLSFLASPGLLKLLPWRVADHEGFPTSSSQRVAALIPAFMGGAMATIEGIYWIGIGAETDSVFFFSFGFNLLLFLRQRLVQLFRTVQRRLSGQSKQQSLTRKKI